MPALQTEDGLLRYSMDGEGTPLLLVHGVGADREAWDQVIAHLKGRYCIIRPDLRGHGQSVKSPGPYSLELFANDCLALLDHVGAKKAHLVGFSLGGLIAQKLALQAPERFFSMTAISSIAGRTPEEQERVLERAKTLLEEGALTHLSNAVERWFTDEFRAARPEILEWRRKKSLQNDPDSYAAAYHVLASSDLADQLHEIELPVLAMTGECDIGSPPHMSRTIAHRVQDGRVVIFPKLKHSVLLEAPDRIAQELEAFLTNLPNSS